MSSIIETIRKEIEFAKSVYSNPKRVVHGVADAFRQDGRAAICDDILKKLDTLQEQEVDKQAGAYADEVLRLENEHPDWDKNVIRATAYHFFDLGCRHAAAMYDDIEFDKQRGAEQEPQGLDEAAQHDAILTYKMPENGDFEKANKTLEARIFHEIGFKSGAKWMAEHINK